MSKPAAQVLVVALDRHQGLRVDRVLGELLQAQRPELSRGLVQRAIEGGLVSIEGATAPIGAKHKVQPGERFLVELPAPQLSSAVPEPEVEVNLVHIDDDVIVVDKPAGQVVHPARSHPRGTLVNGLLGRGLFSRELLAEPDAEAQEEAHFRPGIVHRIDKDTSGLLVIARTLRAQASLKEQFAAHSIERRYEAIAVGEVTTCTIATLHARHPSDRLRFSSRVREGKRAVTHVELVRALRGASLIRCQLETGRTHQIRVHLADRHTPLLGDDLYGKLPKSEPLLSIAKQLGRQALHARTLGFVHPGSGQSLRFESALPADFLAALAQLEPA